MKESLAGNHEYALLTISHICNDNHYPASDSLMMVKQQEQLITLEIESWNVEGMQQPFICNFLYASAGWGLAKVYMQKSA